MQKLTTLKDSSPRWTKNVANATTRRYALATVSSRPVPDFLVIGTKRGGTTSMWRYLTMHPGVLGLFPQLRGTKSSDYFFKHYGRGERWYRSHFHTAGYRRLRAQRLGYEPVTGEASPYYVWDPRVAGRVCDLNPGLKAIVLLRDPVKRAWSHYQERVANGVEPLSFADALDAEERRTAGELDRMLADPEYYSEAHDWYAYRARGLYQPQLENWRLSFPEDQLLVLRSEDLYADVQGTFDGICAFLGIPPLPLPTTQTFGAGKGDPIPAGPRRALADYYAAPNEQLAAYLGRELSWSS